MSSSYQLKTQQGLQKLLAAFKTKNLTNQNVKICLEATGHYWLALYYQLQQHGFSVVIVNPIQSDALRNLYIRKSKTDQNDGFILADLLRLDRATSTQLTSKTVLKLQTLSRTRFELKRYIGGLKNKILGILDRTFPEYPECFSKVFIKTSRELLKGFPSPEELAEVDLTEYVRLAIFTGLRVPKPWLRLRALMPQFGHPASSKGLATVCLNEAHLFCATAYGLLQFQPGNIFLSSSNITKPK